MSFLIYILFLHLIADYVIQSNKININKSKNIYWLLIHVFFYFSCFFIGLFFLYTFEKSLTYSLVNAIIHFIVDFFTSRTIGIFYERVDLNLKKEKLDLYYPILILGIDQFFHTTFLIITAEKWLI